MGAGPSGSAITLNARRASRKSGTATPSATVSVTMKSRYNLAPASYGLMGNNNAPFGPE